MQYDELSAGQDSVTLQDGQNEDWTVVREELHRQAKYMRQLETANARMTGELNILREKQTSVEVLKEQKRELERKLYGTEDLREKVVKLEAELDSARKEREEWCVPWPFFVFFATHATTGHRPPPSPPLLPGPPYRSPRASQLFASHMQN